MTGRKSRNAPSSSTLANASHAYVRFPKRVPALTDEVAEWMKAHGVKPVGVPFLRYLVIDMPDCIDVEIAFPVEHAPQIDGSILNGTVPAGRYATLTFTGDERGFPATGA